MPGTTTPHTTTPHTTTPHTTTPHTTTPHTTTPHTTTPHTTTPHTTTAKIALLMIVKNEAHHIEEILLSTLNHINMWVICDTGSTDNTCDIVEKFYREHKIPGKLCHHQWRDFGYNRTLAFQEAYGLSDYVWVFDTDDFVVGDLKFPELMNETSYMLQYGDTIKYMRKQVFKNDLRWIYRGILHEYAELNEDKKCDQSITIYGDYYIDSRRRRNRSHDPQEYHKDACILANAIEHNIDPELRARYCFYCGQSYKDANDPINAIKYYRMRVELGGWSEEVAYSWLMIGNMMHKYPRIYSDQDIEDAYMNSYNALPIKADASFALGNFYLDLGKLEKAHRFFKISSNITYPKKCVLYNNINIYNGEAINKLNITTNLLNIIKCHDSTKKTLCLYTGYMQIVNLKSKKLNTIYGSELAALKLLTRLAPQYNVYVIQINYNNVTTTIDRITYVSHNAFNLLHRSGMTIDIMIISRYINYFLYCSYSAIQTYLWLHDTILQQSYQFKILPNDGKDLLMKNIHIIDSIICVSEWQRDNFINVYAMHNFIEKFKVIGNAIDTDLFLDKNIKKHKNRFIYCSDFDRNVERVVDYFHIIHKRLPDTTLHIFRDYTDKYKPFIESLKQYPYIYVYGGIDNNRLIREMLSSEVWFYPTSFRETYCISSLEAQMSKTLCIATDLAALHDIVGDRGILLDHHMIQDKKYCVDKVFNILTDKEKKQELIDRAYQWAVVQDWKNRADEWSDQFNMTTERNNKIMDSLDNERNTVIINLERRKDRAETMVATIPIESYQFIKAVDGKQLTMTPEIRRLFEGNDFNYRKGVIGCALSHINIWKDIVDRKKKYTLILEDDIEFIDGFENKLNQCYEYLESNPSTDLLFCGHNSMPFKPFDKIEIVNINSIRYDIYGFYGYIITYNCAYKWLEYIKHNSIKRAIDYMWEVRGLNIMKLVNPIITSKMHFLPNMDSDIQWDYSSLQ